MSKIVRDTIMPTVKEFSEASICQTLDHPQQQYQYLSFNNYPSVIKTDINTNSHFIALHLQVSRSFLTLSARSCLHRCLQWWQYCLSCLFPHYYRTKYFWKQQFVKSTVNCLGIHEGKSTRHITNLKPLSQESQNFSVSTKLHTFFFGYLNKKPSNIANQTIRIILTTNHYSLTPIHQLLS